MNGVLFTECPEMPSVHRGSPAAVGIVLCCLQKDSGPNGGTPSDAASGGLEYVVVLRDIATPASTPKIQSIIRAPRKNLTLGFLKKSSGPILWITANNQGR